MSKENFKVTAKEDGKEYWISRTVAVVGCVISVDKSNKNLQILLERRGEGCPDHVGKLAFPCGYLNWDETLEEAVRREIHEEIGLEVQEEELIEWKLVSDPRSDARQNVVVRYIIFCKDLEKQFKDLCESIKTSEERGGEKCEVSELLLLTEKEVLELPEEEFAFNHKKVILELLEEIQESYEEKKEQTYYLPKHLE